MTEQRPKTRRATQRRRVHALIADKNAHFRETIRRVLGRLGGCVISGEASTHAEVVSQVTGGTPIDLLLLDVEMVTQDRLEELKRLARRFPGIKVAVLLSNDGPEYRQAVQMHGGHFSVAKDSLEEQLPPVLESILSAQGQSPGSSSSRVPTASPPSRRSPTSPLST